MSRREMPVEEFLKLSRDERNAIRDEERRREKRREAVGDWAFRIFFGGLLAFLIAVVGYMVACLVYIVFFYDEPAPVTDPRQGHVQTSYGAKWCEGDTLVRWAGYRGGVDSEPNSAECAR